MEKINQYPGHTDEAFPDVFNKMPPQPTGKKPGQLPEHLIKEYFEKGYLIVEDFFSKDMLEACKNKVEEQVEELAQKLYKGGKIKNLYSEYGFYSRLTKLDAEFPGANVILHKDRIVQEPVQKLFQDERMLNLVEQIIGPEIAAHPVWNLRTKTPQNEATTVPWHQDVGYLDNTSYKVMQATAWIPLLDATETNGCMQVIERGHKTGKVADHQCCYGGTWYVTLDEDEMERKLDVNVERDTKTCPVPYGGMLLINNMIPHRSLPNMSQDIRWSFDIRWQNPNNSTGFYGLKDCLPLRSPKSPNLKVDWDGWNAQDLLALAKKEVAGSFPETELETEFDTTITGPWMKKWELVHMNRHTDKIAV